jgi:hypothetical protein
MAIEGIGVVEELRSEHFEKIINYNLAVI